MTVQCTSSHGHVSRMSIDREFLTMEMDLENKHGYKLFIMDGGLRGAKSLLIFFRIYFEEESGFHGGQADDTLKKFKTGPDNLLAEFVLIGAVAFICIILFIIYIRLAKNEVCKYVYFIYFKDNIVRTPHPQLSQAHLLRILRASPSCGFLLYFS